MKKGDYFINPSVIGVLIFPLCLIAQEGWKVQNPLPTEAYLLAIEPITPTTIYIGGLGGTILRSENGGKSWTIQKLKDIVNIRDISFKDSLNGWLIDSEHIYYTNDGGNGWNEEDIDVDINNYSYLNIKCFNNAIYLILKPRTAVLEELIDAKSLVYKSINNGKTWKQLNTVPGKILCVHFLNEKCGFLYAEETVSISEGYTSFYKTNDGGVTWSKKRFPEQYWTQGLYFISEKIGFVGKYRTIDGGETWENVFEDCLQQNENIDDVFFTDSVNGWAISSTKILQTTDGGGFWQTVNQQSTYQLTDIDFSTNGTGWIVGWAGNIFRKSINSDEWVQLSTGTRNSLNDVFFIDEKEGWCVGTFGCILHTSNGGESWEEQDSNVDSVLFNVKFINNLEGWIAGYYAVLHTSDGGKNWEVRNDLNEWFVDVDFFDGKNGLLIERFGKVYRTTNGGTNWQILKEQDLPRLTSIAIVNENEAWIGGWKGLGHTTDKGVTIQWYDLPNLSLVKEIQFVNNTYGFLINDVAQFLRTTDGGWNWIEIPRGSGLETGPIQAFDMVDQQNGWIYWDYRGGCLRNVKVNQTISVFIDGQYSVPAITHICFINSKFGWAIGSGGTILKYTSNDSTSAGVKKTPIDIFPNPFNETGTNIFFSLQQAQEVSVQIFNSIGQKVQTLYNGVLYEGYNQLSWKPSNIASDIYFISIRCNEFNQVQKCIFVHN